MNPLLPTPPRMLLCAAIALALASLASATPIAAQPTYRCVDKDGHVVVSAYTPGVPRPANCREDAIPVPKAILDQPITEKDIEAVRQHLDQRIGELRREEAECNAQHQRIEKNKEDTLDTIDSLADNRRSGRVTRADTRLSTGVEESAKQAHIRVQTCVAAAQTQIAKLQSFRGSLEWLRAEVPNWRAEQFQLEQAAKQAAIRERQLAVARREAEVKAAAERQAAEERAREQAREAAVRAREAALHAEQERWAAEERLSKELREQWLALLENARGAHEIFAAGGSYEDFSLRLEAMDKQIQLIRVKYARQLQMGNHKTLGMAVYAVYAALTGVSPDWLKERQAAYDVATMQATAERYRSLRQPSAMDRANADENMRWLRGAQQEYERVKARLVAKRDSVARLMSESVKVARVERDQAQQVSVERRNP